MRFASLAALLLLASPALAQEGGSVGGDAAPIVPAPSVDASDALVRDEVREVLAEGIDPAAAPAATLDVMGEDHLVTSRLGSAMVHDSAGREIGDVEDVIIDGEGRVVALLIGLGGTLGLGEKPVAVRFEHITLERNDEGEPRFVLDLARSDLDGAPAFSKPEG